MQVHDGVNLTKRVFLQLTIDIMYWGKNISYTILLKPKKKEKKTKSNGTFSIRVLVSSQERYTTHAMPDHFLCAWNTSFRSNRFQIENIMLLYVGMSELVLGKRKKNIFFREFIPLSYIPLRNKIFIFICDRMEFSCWKIINVKWNIFYVQLIFRW